jgi:hypothetical protein
MSPHLNDLNIVHVSVCYQHLNFQAEHKQRGALLLGLKRMAILRIQEGFILSVVIRFALQLILNFQSQNQSRSNATGGSQ